MPGGVLFRDGVARAAPSCDFEHLQNLTLQPLQAARRNPEFQGFVPGRAVAQKFLLLRHY